MAQTCEFGRRVKIRLIELDRNQAWLMQQIREKTGLYVDDGYLWKILAGRLATPKIVNAIKEVLEIA